MFQHRISAFLFASTLVLGACGGDDQNPSDSAPISRTNVVFNPALSQLPVPSDLQFSAETAQDGTMNAGVDPDNPVITGIDSLDGNSVLSPFDIAIDGSLSATQSLSVANFVVAGEQVIPNPDQNIFLLPLDFPSGDSLSQASVTTEGVTSSVEVPTFSEAATYQAAAATGDVVTLAALAMPKARAEILSLDGGSNNVLRINPVVPLQPKTKYLVIVTELLNDGNQRIFPSPAYEFIRDPESDLSPDNFAGLRSLRTAIQGWERLADGYFGFMQQVFDAAGAGTTAPTVDDIVFTMTFTTGGTTDVLQSIAAPESFFAQSITTSTRKDAIIKLVTGLYALDGTTSSSEISDIETSATLNILLTQATLPGDVPNALYNESVADAIASGADYTTIAEDASAAYLMQRAAAEAAVQVSNSATPNIAESAAGTVNALSQGNPSAVFPVPAPRSSNFYWQTSDISELNPLLTPPARVYQGDITLPYYQQQPTEDDLSPLVTSEWTADDLIGDLIDLGNGNPEDTTPPSDRVTYRYPFPAQQSEVTIPVLVTTPDDSVPGLSKPEAGWPVIIFVHGITGERSTSLPMASQMATACLSRNDQGVPVGVIPGVPCFATVAIDQPLHGVAAITGEGTMGSIIPGLISVNDERTPIMPNVGDNSPSEGLSERHFDVTAAADGVTPTAMDYAAGIGSSGSLFINLTNFTNVRDNLRQMVIDLLNLNASLDSMDLNDDGTADDLDPNRVYFIGHSLGAIDGLPFVAINNSDAVQNSAFSSQPRIRAAAGLMTGGGVIRLLTNSERFAPSILGGLAAASDSLREGTSGLETYLNVFQGIVDSADVTNFAASLSDAQGSTGILLTEVIGDAQNPADSVIPNGSERDPLAGTDPMIAQFGALRSDSVSGEGDGDPAVLVTRFTEGSHSTPVSADNLAVFSEMVSQIVTFFALDGNVTESLVSNPDVVED